MRVESRGTADQEQKIAGSLVFDSNLFTVQAESEREREREKGGRGREQERKRKEEKNIEKV